MRTIGLTVDGVSIPVTYVNTVIVGAGASAMNCAVKLVEFRRAGGLPDPHDSLLVVTGGIALGASRMSGSDKQTYYKMGTSPRVADAADQFARTLTAFGCCHGDTALVEGIGSLRAFHHLVEVGVPFPHDPHNAFIGYKTDHDPAERATSAGPKTSRFMSECLQGVAERYGVKLIDKHPVLSFITDGQGHGKRIVGMLCQDLARASNEDLGLSAFAAENWVLAGGGPGEIYQATVYPPGQYGFHGAAFVAGLVGINLTESQYGLASIKFRWNVSGTYMQAIPRIYSTDADGSDPREFLTAYFDDMPALATGIFLKGYQWPFDAQRITDHQSSLIDMAVHQETVVRGRRVWMDFLANPVGAAGWDEFDIGALGAEALDYLRKTGAVQSRPIKRLGHMNPPAVEIYAENGIDLTAEPLEIAVCAQHMNGGLAVNKWWESNVPHVFVIGEMAGTHGVKRPGGSALNAGQVGALRAAQYIANVYGNDEPDAAERQALMTAALARQVNALRAMIEAPAPEAVSPDEAMGQIRRRMTRFGAHLRSAEPAAGALAQARKQYAALFAGGLKLAGPQDLAAAARTLQQCLTHVAMLRAICGMFERRAGSRGSHCMLADEGIEMHPALIDPATDKPYRFRPEDEELRNSILAVSYNGRADDLFDLSDVRPRPIPDRQIAFEPAWTEYRQGKVYEL